MCKFRDYDNYEVYEDGRIWSYKTNRFLKPETVKGGYQRVQLFDNERKMKRYLLHRVVWESVTGEPIPKNLECNHIDENKKNCSFANINLLTRKENVNYGTRNSRASKTMTNGKLSKQVGAYKDGELVMTFLSTAEAGRQGFNRCAVSACCRNCYNREGNNVYKGFEWRYI